MNGRAPKELHSNVCSTLFARQETRVRYSENMVRGARDLFGKMLQMAVLKQLTGYVLQKEIFRRRGVFRAIVRRGTRKSTMDAGALLELDEVLFPGVKHNTPEATHALIRCLQGSGDDSNDPSGWDG